MLDLYGEILLDHYRLPRNKGRLDRPTVTVEGVNTSCGDQLSLDLEFEGDVLRRVSFVGKGCAISLASASMLAEVMEGKTIAEIEKWIHGFRFFIREGREPEDVELGDLTSLGGVSQLPVRVNCATLPWTTLEEGISRLRARRMK